MTDLDQTIAQLSEMFGDRLSTSLAMREQHGSGESWLRPALPDAVVTVRSTEEVAQVLKLCNEALVPVIPFGAGSSIEGQIHAPKGGISLNLSEMNAILSVEEADMDCTVQCGVTRQQLNKELRATGLFFPVDLGAHATLGGMAATRASGTTTVRYGSMRDLVLGLTVVLPDGQIIKTGSRARKSAAGYDLTRLFVGAEGTLGVITELTVRLFGQPECARSAMCSFPTMEAATEAVVTALQFGLCLNRIELADGLQMQAINSWCKTDFPATPTLWLELTGSEAAVANDLEVLQGLTEDCGATRFDPARDQEAAARLWRFRHEALMASRALRPGIKGISTDVCVPISKLPACIERIQAVIAETPILAPLVGHVGDGNFHMVLLFDPGDPKESQYARDINAALVTMAQELGGTCTGEHGIGLGKKTYMPAEHGPALDLMRKLKHAIDPGNIMNPDKMFDL
ncbi:FAD-binding oxidoreductase [Leisingera caerulea]|uniref:FAD-binding oxidoreductase n=1 Tax=Leisingera caerulea TaxID=506591 RepID=UPI0021A81940|nr:FAD-linked oxidase C-terminal domain-containing protein [Leisingera caerulea]